MKYAVLRHKPGLAHIDKDWKYNIGDCMQSIAMEGLYQKMKIDDYVYVNRCELSSYDGEYVVLPLASYLNVAFKEHFPLSKKIIPVFVGSCLPYMGHKYSVHLINDFSKRQPIGCRDEMTMNLMLNSGLVAYITGCVTATFPRREKEPNPGKVIFVDVPESLTPYIPKHIKDDADFFSHMFPIQQVPIDDEEIDRFHLLALKQLDFYKNQARLIVTSRLHCAAPCMAMGIPVVLVKESFGPTFTWIDKFLPLYDSKVFGNIDWNPKPVEFEEIKQQIVELFSQEIQKGYDRFNKFCSLSDFYEKRNYQDFNSRSKELLLNIKKTAGRQIKCAIWPPALNAYGVMDNVIELFEDYSIVFVDDFLDEETYGDVPIIRSSEIDSLDKETIFFIVSKLVKDNAVELLSKGDRKFFVLC